jgi:hypothetical protein
MTGAFEREVETAEVEFVHRASRVNNGRRADPKPAIPFPPTSVGTEGERDGKARKGHEGRARPDATITRARSVLGQPRCAPRRVRARSRHARLRDGVKVCFAPPPRARSRPRPAASRLAFLIALSSTILVTGFMRFAPSRRLRASR